MDLSKPDTLCVYCGEDKACTVCGEKMLLVCGTCEIGAIVERHAEETRSLLKEMADLVGLLKKAKAKKEG